MSDTLTSPIDRRSKGPPMPGVIVVLEANAPVNRVMRGPSISFGREADPEMSTRHATVAFVDGRWRVTDHGSKNGTSVNGSIVRDGSVLVGGSSVVVRMGGTILLLETSVERYSVATFEYDGTRVTSPAMGIQHSILAAAARDGVRTLIRGETGTGKEHAARVFHENSRYARGPFIAVNASTITEGLAEAQLFGARRGVGTGVEAQVGYIAMAEKGTLFLDEIGELRLELQAKLLRVLEDHMVWPLGAEAPRKIDFQLVCATHKDLEEAIEGGRFRRDFYMRIAQDVVHLPPLRERREEIARLVELALKGTGVSARASFVEACMLMQWEANVRDLDSAVRRAARKAELRKETELVASDLPGWAPVEAVLEEIEEEELAEPEDPRWPELKRLYLQHGDAKKACDLAGVPKSTGHRWLVRAGLIRK